jgi:hypothetical protein
MSKSIQSLSKLHTVEIWESNFLASLEPCNNQLQAETVYLEKLQTLPIGNTIKLVAAPQNVLKTFTKRG